MNNRELGALAAQLGHTELTLVGRARNRWAITCACGYSTAGRNTQLDAIEAGKLHLLKVVSEARRDGVFLPRAGAGRL